MCFKVTGYNLGCAMCSKRDNLQCLIAPDYDYKDGALIERHLLTLVYTQPEGIGYFVGSVSNGRSNFYNF